MKNTTTNKNGITAIYVRRSVSDKDKGNNSLSISAQREECIRFVGDCEYQVYCDDGKSGKDVQHRPAFMQMMQDARDGLISRIVVKKYDRFSRNMREYLNITDELDRYGVTVYSLSEPFNTETKEGRMMRNNLLNFAEFERETIAARVADAYSTRARETGFYQGGKVYYGFTSERRTVNGKTGSVLVPSEQAESIRIAYELYKEPSTSLRDVIEYYKEHDIYTLSTTRVNGEPKENMDRSHVSRILESPLYVRADKEVYAFFVSKGYEILDDIEAYDGVHGVFIHRSSGTTFVKIGYHEGLVDAETWLAVQDKKSHNRRIPNNGSSNVSWLVGLLKFKHCGYHIQIAYTDNKARTKRWKYLMDYGAYRKAGCVKKFLTTRPEEVEEAVLQAMRDRIEQLTIAKHNADAPDSDHEALRTDIIKIDEEIRKLMEKLADADTVLFDYIQNRINELHEQKSALERKLQTKARKRKAINTKPLEEPMRVWDKLSVEDKHDVAMAMIDAVYVSDEYGVEVKFSI